MDMTQRSPASGRTPLEEAHSRLEFNVAAYGKAWTGELEDTQFIVRPLLDEIQQLRAALDYIADGNASLVRDALLHAKLNAR